MLLYNEGDDNIFGIAKSSFIRFMLIISNIISVELPLLDISNVSVKTKVINFPATGAVNLPVLVINR